MTLRAKFLYLAVFICYLCCRFGLRLDIMCLVLLALTAFISGALRTSVAPGTAGLALSYVMQLAGLFQWCTRQSVEVENLSTNDRQTKKKATAIGLVAKNAVDYYMLRWCNPLSQ